MQTQRWGRRWNEGGEINTKLTFETIGFCKKTKQIFLFIQKFAKINFSNWKGYSEREQALDTTLYASNTSVSENL